MIVLRTEGRAHYGQRTDHLEDRQNAVAGSRGQSAGGQTTCTASLPLRGVVCRQVPALRMSGTDAAGHALIYTPAPPGLTHLKKS